MIKNIHPLLINGYNIILSIILLVTGYELDNDFILNKIGKSRFIKFFSDISLEIYCATGIGFFLFMNIVSRFNLSLNNIENILLSAIIIILVACLLKLYTEKTKNIINIIGIKKFFIISFLLFSSLIIIKYIVKIY